MVDPKKAYEQGRKEIEEQRQQQEKAARRTQEDWEAHLRARWSRDMEAAKELISVFDQCADVFARNNLGYFLQDYGYKTGISVFLYQKSGHEPGALQIPIGYRKTTYAFEPIIRKRTETEDEITLEYEDAWTALPSDATSAASEIMRLLGRGELRFGSPWPEDDLTRILKSVRRKNMHRKLFIVLSVGGAIAILLFVAILLIEKFNPT